MAFQKLNYIDEVTVIPAENLNAIQDELIRLISALDGGYLKGDTGVGVASIRQTTTSNTDGGSNVFTVMLTDGTSATFTVKNGSKGSTGATGDTGPTGATPAFKIGTVTTLSAGSKATATITGTAENPVLNLGIPKGADGSSGSGGGAGTDGVGIASILQTTTSTADDGNNIITVTLTNGEQSTFTVQNGSKGSTGETGPAGRGIVSLRRTSGNGAAGTTDVYTITYTDNTTSTFSVYNGANGTGGSGGTGANGATFTPYLDSSGNLSWSNDKGLANPATVNIKGPKGDAGSAGKTPVRGTDYWTAADIAEIKSYVDESILGGAW